MLEQAAQGSGPPDLRMQYLRQIQANHEVSRKTSFPSLCLISPHPPEAFHAPPTSPFPSQMLLKEAQSLRDRLPLGEESAVTAEKLLQVYRQLRNPSLVLL